MATVNTSPLVPRTYEVSLVKCYDPGNIVFDIHDKERSSVTEFENIKGQNLTISEHWNIHHDDPIVGRKYQPGEIVAVNVLNSWKAAMVMNFKIIKGLHYYDVVFIDTGHLLEVHRMTFRGVKDQEIIKHRFAFFAIMDLIPTGDTASSNTSWSADTCHDLRTMFDSATAITVSVMARQKIYSSKRIFGNIFIHIGKQVIDVKEYLLKMNAAYKNPVVFQYLYKLSYEDFSEDCKELSVPLQKLEEVKYENPEIKEITNENLDNHIPAWWRPGGADPLTQRERLSMCHKLSTESRILFARPSSRIAADPALNNPLDAIISGAQKPKTTKFVRSLVSRRDSTSNPDPIEHLDIEDMKQLRTPEPSLESGGYESDISTATSENYVQNESCKEEKETKSETEKPYSNKAVEIFSDEDQKKLDMLFAL